MKKLILLSLALGLTFAGTHLFAGNSWSKSLEEEKLGKDEETEIEPFNFEELPIDIQNEIVIYAWQELNNDEQFKQQLTNCPKNVFMNLKEPNEENKNYKLIPVLFNTVINNKCSIIKVVSLMVPFSFRTGGYTAPLTLKNSEYKTTIKIYPNEIIHACSLSIHGDLAFAWQNINGFPDLWNITFINLEDIKNGKEINLRKGFKTIKTDLYNEDIINGILFNTKGTKLGICLGENLGTRKKTRKIEPLFLTAPSKDKKLTPVQMAKRLKLPTKALKKELEEKRSNNNNK